MKDHKKQQRTDRYRHKTEKADARLEKAREKLPKKKVPKIERTFDEARPPGPPRNEVS